jgi:DNA-directed RNA polymerase subunit RPC12/RpoP
MSKTKYGIIDLEKQTLDSINSNIMNNIDSLKHQNEEHQNTIIQLEQRLKEYEAMDTQTMSEEDFSNIFKIKQQLKDTKETIEHNNSLEYTYFFDTGSKLFKYYGKSDKEVEEDINGAMTKIVKKYKKSQKRDILEDYTCAINNIVDMRSLKIDEDKCTQCSVELQLLSNESKMVCPMCGIQSNILVDTDKATYNDVPMENSYFAYKRLNHLNECLVQFQAKENTVIPQEVCDTIKYELIKERRNDLSKLNASLIRGYLKKHSDKGYNKYYEHIPHILNRLNGIKPKTLTNKMEDDIRRIFMMVQDPFDHHSKTTRNNFLSYNYFLNKACRILNYDEELCNCFPLLKSEEKLRHQDELWEKICKHLNLPFHSSFDSPLKQKNNDVYWKKILI